MALLPFVLDEYLRPSRMLDQHFGMVLDPEDMFSPLVVPRGLATQMRSSMPYLRPWRAASSGQDAGSTVSIGNDNFEANLDVQQFKPEEITVKATGDNTITIEGKHEEQQDQHGFISRHFVRRYVLPKTCDINKVESRLSSDGVLTISAPTFKPNELESRNISITHTGKPMKTDALKETPAEDKS